jgi:hypothetical protein
MIYIGCIKGLSENGSTYDVDIPNCGMATCEVLKRADNVSFSQDVWPIISENCAGCHGIGNSTGYVFTNHTTVSLNANAIVGSMRNEGFQLMPIGGPALPDSLIQKINCWIQQGAPNN